MVVGTPTGGSSRDWGRRPKCTTIWLEMPHSEYGAVAINSRFPLGPTPIPSWGGGDQLSRRK